MSDNPKWKPLLDALPESLHSVIKPYLSDWDKGVNDAFQQIHDTYAPYKQFKDAGVDPQYLVTAYNFTKNFEANPAAVLAEANKTYNLGFYTEDEAKAEFSGTDEGLDLGDVDMDITKHPQFKAMHDALEQIQNTLTQDQQQRLLDQQTQQHNEYLNTLLTGDNEHVDRDFVTALMSQGLTGEQAIERWNAALAQRLGGQQLLESQINTQTNNHQATGTSTGTPAPVVMGGNTGSGSGVPEQPIDFGNLKGTEVNDLVVQMLQASAAENNQG